MYVLYEKSEVRVMERRIQAYTGCLLGLAAGDAMGYGVEHMTLEQIIREHGPNGLLGYDLVNGYAQITSHTQAAAYSCNGLLLGLTFGQMRGGMAPPVRYIAVALQEWARLQGYRRDPSVLNHCWISREDSLRFRRCMDTAMLDLLSSGRLGTMDDSRNRYQGPGALAAAVPVGLFFDPERMSRREIRLLGAETVALTHGNPSAFLSGAALAHIISRVTWDGARDLRALTRETMEVLKTEYADAYRQTAEVCQHLQTALSLAQSPNVTQTQALEQLGCTTASRVLAGALYACMLHPGSFDECMITAVNHSGASAAVGAAAGAILGAMLGADRIPEYYPECLEAEQLLRELASDMFQGCPMTKGSGLFDMDWDAKYVTAAT